MSGALGYEHTAGGEAGHSASTERSEQEAVSGKAVSRQAEAFGEVRQSGYFGATWYELATARGWHHGQATSALSNLHRRGMVTRLEETRQGSSVYVLPEDADGRPMIAQGRRYDPQRLARDVPLSVLQEALRIAMTPAPAEGISETDDKSCGLW